MQNNKAFIKFIGVIILGLLFVAEPIYAQEGGYKPGG